MRDWPHRLRRAGKAGPRRCSPKMVVAGASAYPRAIDFEKLGGDRRTAVALILMVDMAHIAGLVAGGRAPEPRALCRRRDHHHPQDPARPPRRPHPVPTTPCWPRRINSAVFPGTQGGPLEHVIAAKAVCFGEALKPEFKDYAAQDRRERAGHGRAAAGRGASSWCPAARTTT